MTLNDMNLQINVRVMSDVYIGLPRIKSESEMMVNPIMNFSTTSDELSHYTQLVVELTSTLNDDPLQTERSHFESIRTDLMKDPELKDGYVAILDHEVIGHGSNGAELALKMYKEHGYVPILIEKVSEDIKYTSSPLIE